MQENVTGADADTRDHPPCTNMEEVDDAIYAIEGLLAEICVITEKAEINTALRDPHHRRQVAVIIRRIIQRCMEAEKRLSL